MIHSMTGFGKVQKIIADRSVQIEIRSLNSKGLDLHLRVPPFLREIEPEIRKTITEKCLRGKIDCTVIVEENNENALYSINKPALEAMIKELNSMQNASVDIAALLKIDGMLKQPESTTSASFTESVIELLTDAIESFNDFRASEGVALQADIIGNITTIKLLSEELPKHEEERKAAVRAKLLTALQQLDTQVDMVRYEQELIYYLEKYDINEEKSRLQAHLAHFVETANQPANGRKLSFIAQEIGREINTIGSKANHAAMQRMVVEMKDSLEKIKEQCLNVL